MTHSGHRTADESERAPFSAVHALGWQERPPGRLVPASSRLDPPRIGRGNQFDGIEPRVDPRYARVTSLTPRRFRSHHLMAERQTPQDTPLDRYREEG